MPRRREKEKEDIRRARAADARGIVQCLAEAFAPYRDQYTVDGFADTVPNQASVRNRMQQMHLLVAVRNGGIVGTVGGLVGQNGEGHLRGMAVLPSVRGTGIGAQLLAAIEAELRNLGCTRVTLDTTLPLEAAMTFYEKHGYVRSGRVTDFFGMRLIEYAKRL
jgi:GNAT superfamily N-acetyltransferase